jgi:predicted nuclease of predicted toxin-antitoxin system
VRFVVDAQLPPALARWIAGQQHDAEHVADVGLTAASDREIWRYAEAAGAVIVTKDEDFARRRSLESEGPPIVWLRLGNTRRAELLRQFGHAFPMILAALARHERLIEVRPP